MTDLPPELIARRDALLRLLAESGRVAVAFSGGVDSSVVAKAAQLACGEKALAVTAVSPSLASGELEIADDVARRIGIRHHRLHTREFASAGYQANAPDRCFYCKDELYTRMEEWIAELDVDVICNGANLDDQGDHRPGMQAARNHQVRSPLLEAGLTKADVRALARHWDLPVWDKPASPCLSSRIAYGLEVTPERVRRVDAAEAYLKKELGIAELRVRHEQNDLARIEVPLPHLPRLLADDLRTRLTEEFQRLGFRYITLDLEGFRTGSMNAVVPLDQLVNVGHAPRA